MKLALADGGSLYYEVHGDRGPWLVFLNGAMSTTASWLELVPMFRDRHRLILVDFRDQGQSSRLEPGYDATTHCRDLVALLDHLRVERASMLGISYGGHVALAFARDHGDRLSRLVLAAVTARASAHLEAVGLGWEALAAGGDPRLFLELVSPLVYAPRFYAERGAWLRERMDLIAGLLTPAWLEAFVRISESARGYDFTADLASIAAPTLLVCGTEDALMDPDDVFAMSERIPDAIALAIPGAGHGLFIERPRELATAVLGFLAG